MRIIRDDQTAIFILIPVEPEEQELIASLITVLKPEDKISYKGRESENPESRFLIAFFAFGDLEFTLKGSTVESKEEIGRIRDMCYFGSSGLTFLNTTEVNGVTSIIITGNRCKHCNAAMIEFGRCEWKTCEACVAKCDHAYERGAIHGGGIDIGVGEFCGKCGRGKPEEEGAREKSRLEHHLAAEQEIGIPVVYRNGPPDTPQEVVRLKRLARRRARAERASAEK